MFKEVNEQILKLIEKNSRLTPEEIASLLEMDVEEVTRRIKEMEEAKVICGYHTLINWEKTDNVNVSAIIELKVNPQKGKGFDRIAEKIYHFPEVEAVYLMSGGYDFMVQLKKAPMREIANFVSSRLSVIEEVQSTKTHVVLKQYKDHGTMFVGTPWHIRQEAIKALQEGRTFYTANAGLKELREEVCVFTEGRHGVKYDPMHECVITVGGSEAVDISMRVLLNPGDEVIICDPGYVSYVPAVTMADGTPVILPLKEENQFRITPEDLEAVITPKTKAILMNFPNNPTGAVMGREDLEAVCEVLKRHDIIVVSDELYGELTYTGKPHVSVVEIDGMRDRTILIGGFSKAFAMTGWRLGYALAPAPIMEQMYKIHQFAIMSAPTLSQYAGVDALRNSDDDIAEMRDSYNQRRRYLVKRFKDLGIQFGLSSEEFAMRLVEEERLAVVPGTAFGDSGEGFLRISYAYSIEDLKTALDRIEHFITKLRNEK